MTDDERAFEIWNRACDCNCQKCYDDVRELLAILARQKRSVRLETLREIKQLALDWDDWRLGDFAKEIQIYIEATNSEATDGD